MEVGKLYIVWKDKWKGHNVYRVDGDIEFKGGLVSFKKLDGDMVNLNVEQVVRISVSRTIDMEKHKSLRRN